ncbi:hypothetical protein WOLCODRAFT_91060 [Wolfiporia cocos MD-104 SS10]|uniref:Uncharacterized protein n=1 Tax=Wolfiporia cocos (strain MD-104) TaxID=742152 RepID=A0A2H3JRX5_WOLCO|nr:hypothetical protein WOLCODRAFT_91060 [Wolfiporia cocos MD-104 SS10]
MLPFALKVAWFVLSLSGLLSGLVGLPRFASVSGGFWIPILYNSANMIIQGMLCIGTGMLPRPPGIRGIHEFTHSPVLGMIWRMNPPAMPRSFCIVQSCLTATSWFITTSLCATVTIATFIAILHSHGNYTLRVTDLQRSLQRRPSSLSLIIGFPLVSSMAYFIVALKLGAIQASDDMRCDATNPIWVRLLSYAGLPLLLAIPSFLLTFTSIFLLLSSRKRLQRQMAMPREEVFTPIPMRRSSKFKRPSLQAAQGTFNLPVIPALPTTTSSLDSEPSQRTASSTPTPSMILYAISSPPRSLSAGTNSWPAGRAPVHPSAAHPKRYHLPFSWNARSSPRSSPEDRWKRQTRYSRSASPMTFAPPSTAPSARTSPTNKGYFSSLGRASGNPVADAGSDEEDIFPGEMGAVLTGYEEYEGNSMSGSLKWARRSEVSSFMKSELEFAREESETDDLTVYTHSMWEHSFVDSLYACKSPVAWRILFFQLFLATTQIVASISSLVDMLAGRTSASPFGTQHVALILTAWAPTIAFGVLPWRRGPL